MEFLNCIFKFQSTIRNILLLKGIVLREFAFSRAYLFECSLREQVTLDSAECFMRVVISLFYQSQFFSLGLVQTTLYTAIHIITDNSDISKQILLESKTWQCTRNLTTIYFLFGLYNVHEKPMWWDWYIVNHKLYQ